jgi:hypothetical protein
LDGYPWVTHHGTVAIVRIGVGAGFAEDRIEPAVDLATRGNLDFLVFECLAERTIALAQLERRTDPSKGYDPLLDERMRAVLGACAANGVRIITNGGAANPRAACQVVVDAARRIGLSSLRIAAVLGDDVAAQVDDPEMVSANAYLGAGPIAAALDDGADVVVTGRVADASLFVGPLIHAHRWSATDWDRMATAVAIGHLLECGAQLCGGYFAQPGVHDVPGLADLGFPLAEVADDGSVVFTTLSDTGGQLTVATCTEQLLYEVHDPRRYLNPDVVADFSAIVFEEVGPDRVTMRGAQGHRAPELLKVSVGYLGGWIGEGEISYAGTGCVARARLAGDIVKARLDTIGLRPRDVRYDLIGHDAVHRGASPRHGDPNEVRLRVAARVSSADEARRVGREVAGLYLNGPAGGGGVRRQAFEQLAVRSTYLARDLVRPTVEWTVV